MVSVSSSAARRGNGNHFSGLPALVAGKKRTRQLAIGIASTRRWRAHRYCPALLFLFLLPFPTSQSAILRGGGAHSPPPDHLGRALQESLKPNDLWPSSEQEPGHLDRQFQGYLRPGGSIKPQKRVPPVLHRVIFLGDFRSIQEPALLSVMDETMASAYMAWKSDPEMRFKLWNLEEAEAYIAEHFESKVLEAFQKLQPFAFKADLFRYLVLYREGGWYIDLKLGCNPENRLSLHQLLDALAAELSMDPEAVGFVAAGQNMVWNVPGAEGIMNAFLGAKARHRVLGDTVVRIVDDVLASAKGCTPWSLTGPYALYVGAGKRRCDARSWQDFNGSDGVALMRFGFDEWHLPRSGAVVIRKASRGECGGGWSTLGGNNYVDLWFGNEVFASESSKH
jgi:hypothetical protein